MFEVPNWHFNISFQQSKNRFWCEANLDNSTQSMPHILHRGTQKPHILIHNQRIAIGTGTYAMGTGTWQGPSVVPSNRRNLRSYLQTDQEEIKWSENRHRIYPSDQGTVTGSTLVQSPPQYATHLSPPDIRINLQPSYLSPLISLKTSHLSPRISEFLSALMAWSSQALLAYL